MPDPSEPLPSFVIKAEDLTALNYLAKGYPRPQALTWINRGTNQQLRRSTVQMLLRTLFTGAQTASVVKLHQSAGLRVSLASERDRAAFAKTFADARALCRQKQRSALTAVFDRPEAAERSFKDLVAAGVDNRAISILWRAGQFIQERHEEPQGHSRLSVVAASAGGGLAGAILGVSLLAVPGFGIVAAGGAIAASALSTIGAFGGALGATGGAIARMLTDLDVDGRDVPFYELAIETGKVFVSVDPGTSRRSIDQVRSILAANGGNFAQFTVTEEEPDWSAL